RKAEGDQSAELITGRQSDDETISEQKKIKSQQKQSAGHAEFFRQHDENKIGMFFGQELQLALGAVAIAFAEQPAGTKRDLGLQNIVTRTKRIGARIDKGHQSRAL